MLKVTTAEEMRQIDRLTIEKYGIAGTILMERAGLAVVSRINEIFFDSKEQRAETGEKKIIILCGGGNNGGDGLVAARILHNQGRDVEVFLTVPPRELKGDAEINYKAANKFGVRIYPVKKFLICDYERAFRTAGQHGSARAYGYTPLLIVDALLGTGLKKDVRSPLTDIINKVNALSAPVVAVDIPSGISSDAGQIMGCAVKAQATVTFGLPKTGHYMYPGAEYAGRLYVEEIGFPRELIESEKIRTSVPQKEDILSMLPVRPKHSHKGRYGHVLFIAGSRGKTGAALMAAKACLRSGAGLVTIGVPETLVNSFQSRVTEEMLLPLMDKGNGTVSCKSADTILEFINKRANVIAVGPGLSTDDEISKLLRLLVSESRIPLVIDADGLNALAGNTDVLKKAKAPIILTPHSGEMARLLQKPKGKSGSLNSLSRIIEQDRILTAVSFAKRTKTYLVLKGAPTIIASPEGNAFINPTGNPGMATAGTGDVLTGMISALLAQRLSSQNAALAGVFLHGLAGDLAARIKGEYSLIASDLISKIPEALRSIKISR